MQLGSMFISNCNITLHVSDAICVHHQEHLKTVVATSGVWHETGWSRVILQLLINILPSCITLVLYIQYVCNWWGETPRSLKRSESWSWLHVWGFKNHISLYKALKCRNNTINTNLHIFLQIRANFLVFT